MLTNKSTRSATNELTRATAGIDWPLGPTIEIVREKGHYGAEHEKQADNEANVILSKYVDLENETTHTTIEDTPLHAKVWINDLRVENYVDEIDAAMERNIADLRAWRIKTDDTTVVVIEGKSQVWRTEWPVVDEHCCVPGEQLPLCGLIARLTDDGFCQWAIIAEEPQRVRKCRAVMCSKDHDVYVPWAFAPHIETPTEGDWDCILKEHRSEWKRTGRKPLAFLIDVDPMLYCRFAGRVPTYDRVVHGIIGDDDSPRIVCDHEDTHMGTTLIRSPDIRLAPSKSLVTWVPRTVSVSMSGFMDTMSADIARVAKARTMPTRVYDLLERQTLPSLRIAETKPYMAISYVWNDWTEEQALEVAQKAAAQTGLRYVWMDKLCILQGTEREDLDDKAKELPKMGDYYANAALTIILDRAFVIPSKALVTTGTLVPANKLGAWAEATWDSIETSRWATRKWTFQEGMCSRNPVITDGTDGISLQVVEEAVQDSDYGRPYAFKMIGMKCAEMDPDFRRMNPRWKIGKYCSNWKERFETCGPPNQSITRMSLHTAVKRTWTRQASAKEDLIYALIGLLPGGDKMTLSLIEDSETTWLQHLMRELKKNNLIGLEVMASEERADGEGNGWMPSTFSGLMDILKENQMYDGEQTSLVDDGLVVEARTLVLLRRTHSDDANRWVCESPNISCEFNIETLYEWEDMEDEEVLAVLSEPIITWSPAQLLLVRGYSLGWGGWHRVGAAVRAIITLGKHQTLSWYTPEFECWCIC